MELSNLKPAEGSKHSDAFRRGRGHGSGNGKTEQSIFRRIYLQIFLPLGSKLRTTQRITQQNFHNKTRSQQFFGKKYSNFNNRIVNNISQK